MSSDELNTMNPASAASKWVSDLLESGEDVEKRFFVPKAEGLFSGDSAGHFHTTPELFLQLAGKVEFVFPQERMVLSAGNICLVPPGLPHDEIILQTNEFLQAVVCILPDSIRVHFGGGEPGKHPRVSSKAMILTSSYVSRLTGYLNDYIDISERAGSARSYCVEGMSRLILGTFLELMESPAEYERSNDKVVRCQRYIERDFTNPLMSVKYLAQKVRCSPDYLSHLFNTETGHTINNSINEYRLRQAQMLLSDSRLNISEVARHCGFNDPGYFIRKFKNKHGVTPRQYRQGL